jgi:Uma2 family endonuclease
LYLALVKPETTIPPRTLLDVFRLLPEGTRAEVIDGQLLMSPSPTSRHQLILNQINLALTTAFRETGRAIVIPSPIDVYLDETTTAVQPDLAVVGRARTGIIHPDGHIHVIPDLVVEVLSPFNRDFDLNKKRAVYEHFGVPEYWIVDPADLMCVCCQLTPAGYQTTWRTTGRLKSNLLQVEVTITAINL